MESRYCNTGRIPSNYFLRFSPRQIKDFLYLDPERFGWLVESAILNLSVRYATLISWDRIFKIERPHSMNILYHEKDYPKIQNQ